MSLLVTPALSRLLSIGAALLATAACRGSEKSASNAESAAAAPGGAAAVPSRAARATGFKTPESAKYDSTLDVFFVSNINGGPGDKDNNGFISRMRPDGTIDSLMFIAGGRNGVTLNAPKGLAITGDTLWVADIDAVRAFNKRTGAPVATVDFTPQKALFLNDVTVGPDGSIYVTDTGVRFGKGGMSHPPGTDRVFRIGPNRSVSVALTTDSLSRPNGITWDAAGSRFVIVPFGAKTILAWKPGAAQPTVIGYGAGELDGVEVLSDGRLLVSSWADSSVAIRSGNQETLIKDLPSPADIGVDTKRQHVAVPLFTQNRVEIWNIPPAQQ